MNRLLCFALLVLGGGSTTAQDLVLEPAQDNTLYEDTNGTISNGSGPHLYVGQTAIGSVRRGVLEFDLSGVAPGTPVERAELSLNLNLEPPGAGPTPISVHFLETAWGESSSNAGEPGGLGAAARPDDATWIHTFFNTGTWGTPGGDFDTLASAVTSVNNPGSYTWSGDGLAAHVQTWIDSPDANHGLIFVGDETTTRNARRFDSREGSHPPALAVSFGAVPEPATLGLFGLGVALILSLHRKRRNSP